MPIGGDEVQRLMRERETLLGLLKEAENGHSAVPSYDGMPTDPLEISIQATRAKLARIEALLAEHRGG